MSAFIFHFRFEPEIRMGLHMVKYISLHAEYFRNPGLAFVISVLYVWMALFTEFALHWNLLLITTSVKDIIFDFIALAVIADFHVMAFDMYSQTKNAALTEMTLKVVNFRKSKRMIAEDAYIEILNEAELKGKEITSSQFVSASLIKRRVSMLQQENQIAPEMVEPSLQILDEKEGTMEEKLERTVDGKKGTEKGNQLESIGQHDGH
jgi:hypothetical protein